MCGSLEPTCRTLLRGWESRGQRWVCWIWPVDVTSDPDKSSVRRLLGWKLTKVNWREGRRWGSAENMSRTSEEDIARWRRAQYRAIARKRAGNQRTVFAYLFVCLFVLSWEMLPNFAYQGKFSIRGENGDEGEMGRTGDAPSSRSQKGWDPGESGGSESHGAHAFDKGLFQILGISVWDKDST